MKYLQLAIALVFFWSNTFSQVITIDQFQDLPRDKFDPVDGKAQVITAKSIEDGFKIQIKVESGIEKVKQKNAADKFIELLEFESVTGGKLFSSIKGAKPEDGKLIIKLIKGAEEKTLSLTIQPSQEVVIPSSTPCVPTQSKTDCNPVKNYDNQFGEDVKYYDKRKIVYVYDFNKDPSKRDFYKIRKKNGNLKIDVVNFNKETLTSGKNVKFKIYNVNKFIYDVSIADSLIHFDSEPSALFTRLFLGDSTLLGGLMGAFSDNINAQSTMPEADKLNGKIRCFVEKYNWLQNKVLDAYDPCYAFPYCYRIEYTELANDLTAIRADAVQIQMRLDEKKKIIEDNKKEIEACEKNEKDLKDNLTAITKCEGEIKAIEQKLQSLSGEEKKKKEEDLTKKEEELKKLQEDKVKLEKISSEKCTQTKKEDYKKKKETAESELSKISVINTVLTNLPSDRELKKIVVFLRNMVEINNSHTIDYIPLHGNMLDLTLNIASKDSIFKYLPIPEYKSDPLQIQIPILGKPFVSFSSGSFIALGKHLQNKTYSWQGIVGNNNTVSDSNFTLVESGYTLPPMGFCALGNIEWKVSRSFGLGGSSGVGLSIEKSPRMAYLGGVSLFFGDLHQFTITGGFVGMQVNKLTNNFQTVADNQVIYTSRPDIQYYQEFKVGGFISLTYTPFKVYKTKAVKSKNK